MFNIKLTVLILCSSLLVLIAGLSSELSLGDEVCHYRFAKDIFNSGRRVAFDSLYDSGSPPGYFYNSPPFWHILLASIWRLSCKISFPVAQLYHTLYYALLILFTYLLGKELYGQKQGLYSALIVATIPATVAFSVLFYLDIPATCLSVLGLLLIVKRKYLWAGIALGLMYLTKRNTCFFVPAFFFLILCQAKISNLKKIKNICYFFVPAFLFLLYDILWRESGLKSITRISGKEVVSQGNGTFEYIINRLTPTNFMNWNLGTSDYLNSHLSEPMDVVKYFGIILLITLAMYVLFKLYEKKDLKLWGPVICFFFFFCYIFNPTSDIRYLLPVMPLLAILSSKVIIGYTGKIWLSILVFCICILQLGATAFYVKTKRQIPKGIEEGFAYLRNETAPDALIIYPEYVILERANRRFAWGRLNTNRELKVLFWSKDEGKVRDFLKSNAVDYIAVKKSRIYDDLKAHHFGGYPKSFVERLPFMIFVDLIFENEDMSIWKVLREQTEGELRL